MFLWISGFFRNEKVVVEQKKAAEDMSSAVMVIPPGKKLEVLLKNDYFLKKKVAIIEEFILPLQPTRSFPFDHPKTIYPMSRNGNESCDSFQEISPMPSRSETPIIMEESRKEVGLNEEREDFVEEEKRLSKYKVLVDPMTGERALYRRIDEQTSGYDGDWILGLGDGRFLIIGAWPVLIASNIIVFALGFYLHSAP